MRYVHLLVAIALVTASFDLLFAVDLFGQVRLSQMMLMLVIIAALGQVIQSGVVLWPRGGTALALWCVLQGVLITQSPAPTVSLILYALLIFTVCGIYAVLQLYGRGPRIRSLMKIYLRAYVFVGCFGAVQFVSPALHLGAPLVRQWIIHGLVPRINAFSYEPSYFATYLVMGWIMLIDLRLSKAQITAGRSWGLATVLLTAVLFLSTSRTAWIFMIIEVAARIAPSVWRLVRQQTGRLRVGSLVFPLPSLRLVLVLFAVGAGAGLFLQAVSRVIDLNFFLAGTGLNHTAAHSFLDRFNVSQTTLEVIRLHPWIGRSLGGVPATIANLKGGAVATMADVRLNWGFPVPLEVLAASGIPGFGLFFWFFWVNTAGQRTLIRERWSDERAKWLRALVRGMIFEWIALLADQNLIRVYLWMHVTMLVLVGYNLRFSPARPASVAPPAPLLPLGPTTDWVPA